MSDTKDEKKTPTPPRPAVVEQVKEANKQISQQARPQARYAAQAEAAKELPNQIREAQQAGESTDK